MVLCAQCTTHASSFHPLGLKVADRGGDDVELKSTPDPPNSWELFALPDRGLLAIPAILPRHPALIR